VRGVSPCCTMKAVLGFLELYLHDAPDDDEDSLSIDAASYSSRTTTSTSGACGANGSPNTSAGGGVVGGGIHGPSASYNVPYLFLYPFCIQPLILTH